MGTRTTYAGAIRVHYGYLTVRFGDEQLPDLADAFAGQDNGLCGAADPRGLFLITGLHTGRVAVTIEVHDEAPVFDPDVEEIVEACFHAPTDGAVLGSFDDGPYPCGISAGDWRVRYSARGMDAAAERDTNSGEPIDRYLLQFWPGPSRIDRVVRQTSAKAGYWHEFARSKPALPTSRHAERRASEMSTADRRRSGRRMANDGQGAGRRRERSAVWGGREPSARLRSLGGNVRGLASRHRALLDDLEAADPTVQRDVAMWAAERACEVGGLTSLDWVAAGLDAVRSGAPLPEPFDDHAAPFRRLFGDGPSRLEVGVVDQGRMGDAVPRVDPRAAALPAIRVAVHADPLRAAVDALSSAFAAHGPDAEDDLVADLRSEFPSLG